jgi:hypothetical protein
MRKTLKWIVLGLLALIVAAAVGGYLMVRSSGHPKIDGDLKLASLTAPVRVLRDELGIPYLFAANTPDLLRAQGFVTAQNRLMQMELLRASWRGELAATFGAEALPSDIRMRVLGIRRNGDRHALKLDARVACLPPELCRRRERLYQGPRGRPSDRVEDCRPGTPTLERGRPGGCSSLPALHALDQFQGRGRGPAIDRQAGFGARAADLPAHDQPRLGRQGRKRRRCRRRAVAGRAVVGPRRGAGNAQPPGTRLEQLGGRSVALGSRARRWWSTTRTWTAASCPATGTRSGSSRPACRRWARRFPECPASWSDARSTSRSASRTRTATCRTSTSRPSILPTRSTTSTAAGACRSRSSPRPSG